MDSKNRVIKDLVILFGEGRSPFVFASGDKVEGRMSFSDMVDLVKKEQPIEDMIEHFKKNAIQVQGSDIIYKVTDDKSYTLGTEVVPIKGDYVIAPMAGGGYSIYDLAGDRVVKEFATESEARLRANGFAANSGEDYEEYEDEFEESIREIVEEEGYKLDEVIEHSDSPREYVLSDENGRYVLSFDDNLVVIFDPDAETLLTSIQAYVEYSNSDGVEDAIKTALSSMGDVSQGAFDKIKNAIRNVKDTAANIKNVVGVGSIGNINSAISQAKSYLSRVVSVDGIEDRYNQKTGKKIGKEIGFNFNGEDFILLITDEGLQILGVDEDGDFVKSVKSGAFEWNGISVVDYNKVLAQVLGQVGIKVIGTAEKGDDRGKDTDDGVKEEVASDIDKDAEEGGSKYIDSIADAVDKVKVKISGTDISEVRRNERGIMYEARTKGEGWSFVIRDGNLIVVDKDRVRTTYPIGEGEIGGDKVNKIYSILGRQEKMRADGVIRGRGGVSSDVLRHLDRSRASRKVSGRNMSKEMVRVRQSRFKVTDDLRKARASASGGFDIKLKDYNVDSIVEGMKSFVAFYDIPLQKIVYRDDGVGYSYIFSESVSAILRNRNVLINYDGGYEMFEIKSNKDFQDALDYLLDKLGIQPFRAGEKFGVREWVKVQGYGQLNDIRNVINDAYRVLLGVQRDFIKVFDGADDIYMNSLENLNRAIMDIDGVVRDNSENIVDLQARVNQYFTDISVPAAWFEGIRVEGLTFEDSGEGYVNVYKDGENILRVENSSGVYTVKAASGEVVLSDADRIDTAILLSDYAEGVAGSDISGDGIAQVSDIDTGDIGNDDIDLLGDGINSGDDTGDVDLLGDDIEPSGDTEPSDIEPSDDTNSNDIDLLGDDIDTAGEEDEEEKKARQSASIDGTGGDRVDAGNSGDIYITSIEVHSGHAEHLSKKEEKKAEEFIRNALSSYKLVEVNSWFKNFFYGNENDVTNFAKKCKEGLDDYLWIVGEVEVLSDKMRKELNIDGRVDADNDIETGDTEPIDDTDAVDGADLSGEVKALCEYIGVGDIGEPDEDGIYTYEKEGLVMFIEPTGDFNFSISMGLVDDEENSVEATGDKILEAPEKMEQARASILPGVGDKALDISNYNMVKEAAADFKVLEKPSFLEMMKPYTMETKEGNMPVFFIDYSAGDIQAQFGDINISNKVTDFKVENVKEVIAKMLGQVDRTIKVYNKIIDDVEKISKAYGYETVKSGEYTTYKRSGLGADKAPIYVLSNGLQLKEITKNDVKVMQLAVGKPDSSVRFIEDKLMKADK